jgi:hypothetical protein
MSFINCLFASLVMFIRLGRGETCALGVLWFPSIPFCFAGVEYQEFVFHLLLPRGPFVIGTMDMVICIC